MVEVEEQGELDLESGWYNRNPTTLMFLHDF